jgi:hypothetical protein
MSTEPEARSSPLDDLPMSVSHGELRRDNAQRWQQQVTPNAQDQQSSFPTTAQPPQRPIPHGMAGTDQPLPDFGGLPGNDPYSDEPEIEPGPDDEPLTPISGEDQCR